MYSFRLSWGALSESELILPRVTGDAFMFGAAPNPVVPKEILGSAAIVTANASQITLEAHGVAKPHITFMRTNMARGRPSDAAKVEIMRDRRTGLLVLMSEEDPKCQSQLELLSRINYRYDDLLITSPVQRSMVHNDVLGTRMNFLLKRYRPSMGLQGALFCLGMGASRVAMAGFSFRSGGWSYTSLWQDRKHLDGDRVIVERVRQRELPVFAIEQEFSADTGLRRWSSQMATAA